MRDNYDFTGGKRGAVITHKGKTRITIFIDNQILEAFRKRAEAAGTGYQTMMNDALRTYLLKDEKPVTEGSLRNILRQELPQYLATKGGTLSPALSQGRGRNGPPPRGRAKKKPTG